MLKEKISIIWYWFVAACSKILCSLVLRIRVYGRENVPRKGSFLLISNHQSFLDPVFCATTIRRRLCFLARDSLFSSRIFGTLIASVNAIPVRRGHADLTAMKNIIGRLKEGGAVLLFPEATRTDDGKISAFKPGFGLLCRRGKAAVVPVVIDGAFECWPRHKKIFTPGKRIELHYGKCITAEEVKKMTDRELAENLTNTLRQMQTQCRTNQGKEAFDYQ